MKNFKFGVDYYPEHWPEERWETDAKLMNEMGIKVVRLAEFSWHKMEPTPGNYNFDWLHRVINLLKKYNISVILGTPSAAAPAWLINKYPEILPVDSNGIQRGFGGRHHVCQSNKIYREYVTKIVHAMAKEFSSKDLIEGWQIDNEFGNSHEDFCHCNSCKNSFREWLKNKYKNIESVNSAWGTYFWSQTYNDFSEIPTPLITPNSHNPSLLLDWKSFRSDLIVNFQQFQIDIIKNYTGKEFITHNFMGFFDLIDYYDLAKNLDFVSHDQYITGYWNESGGSSPQEMSATLNLISGLKEKPFWIMEQQAGPTGWEIMGKTPEPGQLALWAFQSISHGADTVVFFRWRTCSVGTEEYWHGILPHSGVPGKRFYELKEFILNMGSVMPKFEGYLSKPEVAILHSYKQNWALEIQPHHPNLDYNEITQNIYNGFHTNNIEAAIISEDSDFSKFKLIVAPPLFLDNKELEVKLKEYIHSGGKVIFTPRTGVKNETNLCKTDKPIPGVFSDILGIEVLDYDCLRVDPVTVNINNKEFYSQFWWDTINLKSAKGEYPATSYPHTNEYLLSKNNYGNGVACYLATFPTRELSTELVKIWSKEMNLKSVDTAPDGIELVTRQGDNEIYLFAANHTNKEIEYKPSDVWKLEVGSTILIPYSYSVYSKKV